MRSAERRRLAAAAPPHFLTFLLLHSSLARELTRKPAARRLFAGLRTRGRQKPHDAEPSSTEESHEAVRQNRRRAGCGRIFHRRHARGRAGEAHRLVGQGFLQVRGRRAVRGDQEVRGQDRRQGRAFAIRAAGNDPEDRRGARRRHAARCRVRRRLRLPGREQVGVRGQARGPFGCHRSDQGQVPQGHRRDDLPVQRQDQEEGVLRVSAEAADDAHPVLEEHARGSRIQGVRHPEGVEGVLGLLVRQGAAGPPQQDRQEDLRGRPTAGRGFERRVLLVPDVRRRLQRQAGRRQRQAAGRRSEGQGGAGQHRQGLLRASAPAAARRRRRRTGRTRTTTWRSSTTRSC